MNNQPWQPPSRIPVAPGNGPARRGGGRATGSPYPDMLSPPRLAAPGPQIRRPRPPMPIALPPRDRHVPVGMAISRPTQMQQWPLVGGPEPRQQYRPPPGRGPAPPRPPRPSQVPIAFDISQLEVESPTSQYSPGMRSFMDRGDDPRWDDDGMSPIVASPMTQDSHSSAGSIPDFPIPVPPIVPRRSANLGPPPSSRRGVSSYYSRASFVSPIPEESLRTASHLSYASSAAMPASWESNSQRHEDDEDEDEDIDGRRSGDRAPSSEEGRDSRGSGDERGDETGLIRSASFGRRAKPSMINTRSLERIEARAAPASEQMPIQMYQLEKVDTPMSAGEKEAGGPPRHNAWPTMGHPASPLASGTGLIDRSSEESLATAESASGYAADPKPTAMLGAYHAASAFQPGSTVPTPPPSRGKNFSPLSAVHRPPRLNLDAVRDAEARGSLTSLPDLIQRATRLASMIDRGKRPASRMALNDFPSNGDFKEIGVSNGSRAKLGTFPPATSRPGTPASLSYPWPGSYRPSSRTPSPDSTERDHSKPPRRCCGLPCWAFLLVLLVLLGIIAAAVVVPVKFLVLDKSDDSATRSAAAAASSCALSPATSCQNGGTSILDEGGCACICTNGFTGSTCTEANSTGCSAASNVTMGDALARLIVGSSNFSIPLDQETILGRLNAANSSCAMENALVTFEGSAGASLANERRQAAPDPGTPVIAAQGSVATLNSIIYDSSTPSPGNAPRPVDASPTASASPASSTTTPATASGSPDADAEFRVTEVVLDFARVAVLYILQQETLEKAITAQGALQGFFELPSVTNLAARKVNVGGGNVVDLVGGWVDVGEGSVGGTGVGSGSGTRSSKRGLGAESV
ncbi:hypothetical protein QTJ16_000627 [Diplocarpon rosae]|uniref:EGF-like domain-containing protein n=1 Tax=Diplocarpon rosae TaxID=946125 RepID=A0AAD9WFI6_9HELO|nr:hypothetical protein QTJ16_000627 [Diplocarpon rosae]